jgi:hypothetical protein
MSFSGWFTMMTPTGGTALLNGDAGSQGFYGFRSSVSGTMHFDLTSGTGTGTVVPFSFFGSGNAAATTISFQSIGDGAGGPGSLVLGNMGFNWAGNNGIPVSIVMDAAGLFGYLNGQYTGATPADGMTSDSISGFGALPATNGQAFLVGKATYTLPLGPSPIATTTWNTADIGAVGLGTNPSGTLPLTDDGIGGSPMKAGPFPNYQANFDISNIHIDAYNPDVVVPVPAAVWLFGSGLVGLVGVARRRKQSS